MQLYDVKIPVQYNSPQDTGKKTANVEKNTSISVSLFTKGRSLSIFSATKQKLQRKSVIAHILRQPYQINTLSYTIFPNSHNVLEI